MYKRVSDPKVYRGKLLELTKLFEAGKIRTDKDFANAMVGLGLESPEYMREYLKRARQGEMENKKLNNAIFRDRVVARALSAIAGDDFARQRIVLQGGAAMRVAYGSPRRTKDVDFSFLPEVGGDEREMVLKRIQSFELKPIDGNGITLEVKGLKTGVFRFTYKVEYAGQAIGIPLEIGTNAGPIRDPVLIQSICALYGTHEYESIQTSGLLVMNPSEMIADKIFANVSRLEGRDSFKVTDIWDISYLLNYGGKTFVDPDLVLEKAAQFWDGASLSRVIGGMGHLKSEIEKNRGKLRELSRVNMAEQGNYMHILSELPDFFHQAEYKTIDFLSALMENGPKLHFFYNAPLLQDRKIMK